LAKTGVEDQHLDCTVVVALSQLGVYQLLQQTRTMYM